MLFLLLLQVGLIMCKCTTTYVTLCETVEDLKSLGAEENVIIENGLWCNDCYEVFTGAPLTNLKSLVIIGRLIKIQPNSFANLRLLKKIKLNKNKLSALSNSTFIGLSLEKLDLQDNSIKIINTAFLINTTISDINFSRNKLIRIEAETFNVANLKVASLSHNKLYYISDRAFNTNLQYLDLSYNKFTRFTMAFFKRLENLRTLILSNNKLTIVTAVPALIHLEKLDLSHNEIHWIADGAFSYPGLIELHLQYNKLVFLSHLSFEAGQIEKLYLHGNLLAFLPNHFGDVMGNLKYLSIGGNPWSCSCLVPIYRFMDTWNVAQEECDRKFMGDGNHPVCLTTGTSGCYGNESGVILSEQPENIPMFLENYNCK